MPTCAEVQMEEFDPEKRLYWSGAIYYIQGLIIVIYKHVCIKNE